MTRPWMHVGWDVEQRLLAGEPMESIRARPCPDAYLGDRSDIYWGAILARLARGAARSWRRLCLGAVPGGLCRRFLRRRCRPYCQAFRPFVRSPLVAVDPDGVGLPRGWKGDVEVGRRLERVLREHGFKDLEEEVHAAWLALRRQAQHPERDASRGAGGAGDVSL